jgi:hypothetical protein
VIGEGPDAHEWKVQEISAAASHVNDSIAALSDGIEPKNSGDQDVPRFTWWPHRGTDEWVEYTFKEPCRLTWSEVYWYDDTSRGVCRIPASWKLLYKDGDTWREVPGVSGYPTEKDAFNRSTFDAITTTSLRLQVTLQPNRSGGILEWRVGS